jgi:hypothetical protein
MVRTKKSVEVEVEASDTPLLLNVMDRETKQKIRIDANKETDWKTKYLHISGKEF